MTDKKREKRLWKTDGIVILKKRIKQTSKKVC